jgi:glucose/mannose-6-phosphate isomerase
VLLDQGLLDDADALQRRDEYRLLWALATAGAQVRHALGTSDGFDLDRLRGEPPRSLLVATDGPPSAVARLLTRLSSDRAPALTWHGVELPRWAGPSDALLVGAVDGRHPRLAVLVDQAAHRGMAVAVVAPGDSPVAAAAARVPLHELASVTNPRAARWAVLTPLLQALDALGLGDVPASLLAEVADALDETAEQCRPSGDSFTNPAKALAVDFGDSRPVIVGAGVLASVAARSAADAVQLGAGIAAASVSLPDGIGRAGALLRGPLAAPDPDDLFRDRVEDAGPPRARLLLIGDDGDPTDPDLGNRSGAQLQLDEIAARRAATALRGLAESLGVRASGVDLTGGAPLARFASACAFGDFTAAYLGFALGLDPGAARPAELGH